MKNKSVLSILIALFISLSITLSFANEDIKPTLIIFSADWCHFCNVAKNDINTDENLSEIIKNFNVVVADYDVDKDLVDGYNIKSVPSFVILKNKNLTKKVGYNGPKDLIRFLKKGA